ncbi:YceI family protein [Porticoccaceae bacterium LTM1]|nr:YceI family protein [Porticoccaceae bacterium LTM1]
MKQPTQFLIALFFLLLMPMSGCQQLLVGPVATEMGELRAGKYRLDPDHTTVLFKVSHLGISTYVGRFNQMTASLNFDPGNMAVSTLEGRVETASVDVNNSNLEKTLQGNEWFACEQFPQAQFVSALVTPLSENQFRFAGNLTLRGETKPISLIGTFHGGASNRLTGYYTLGFSAVGTIKRSEFGMDKYSGLVGDEVTLEIYAEFQKQ